MSFSTASSAKFSVNIRDFGHPVLRTFISSCSFDVLQVLRSIKELTTLSTFSGLFAEELNVNVNKNFLDVNFLEMNNDGSLRYQKERIGIRDSKTEKRLLSPKLLVIQNASTEALNLPSKFNGLEFHCYDELVIDGFRASVDSLRPFLTSATVVQLSKLTIVGPFCLRDFLKEVQHVKELHLANWLLENDDLETFFVNPTKTFKHLTLVNVATDISYKVIEGIQKYRGHLFIRFNAHLSSSTIEILDNLGIEWNFGQDMNTREGVTYVYKF